MPTTTVAEVTAYAHCVTPRCRGYQQAEVRGILKEDTYTYAERGGDLPGPENSFVYLSFAKEDEDAPCPHCGERRDLSLEPRRQYANISGHNPEGLLDIEPYDPRRQAEVAATPPNNEEREKMLGEIAELRGMVTALLATKPQEPEDE